MKATLGLKVGDTFRRSTDNQFWKVLDIVSETDKTWLVRAERPNFDGKTINTITEEFRVRKSTKTEKPIVLGLTQL